MPKKKPLFSSHLADDTFKLCYDADGYRKKCLDKARSLSKTRESWLTTAGVIALVAGSSLFTIWVDIVPDVFGQIAAAIFALISSLCTFLAKQINESTIEQLQTVGSFFWGTRDKCEDLFRMLQTNRITVESGQEQFEELRAQYSNLTANNAPLFSQLKL